MIELAVVLALVVVGRELESRRHARVVADLCQRLQAPETAVAMHAIGPEIPVSHLPFDDDAAWLKYATDTISTDELG